MSSSDHPSQDFHEVSKALLVESTPCLEDINELLEEASLVVTGFIASGGAGDVLVGHQTTLDREVAIKLIPINPGDQPSETFLREGQISARLSHPNIVSVYEAPLIGGAGEPYCCIVMELIEAGNLANNLPRSLEAVVRVMTVVCEAVDYAHQKGVIHCDLKPENILMVDGSKPKITDFGISRIIGDEHSGVRLLGGDYLAPEQQKQGADSDDPRRDVFSLGVLLKRLVRSLELPQKASSTDEALKRELLEIAEEAACPDVETRIPSAKLLRQRINEAWSVRQAMGVSGLPKRWIKLGLTGVGAGLVSYFAVVNFKQKVMAPVITSITSAPAQEPRYSGVPHPKPLPIILDVHPSEILDSDENFWLEIRGENFRADQKYHCFASNLVLENRAFSENAPAHFVNDQLLKVRVLRVVGGPFHDQNGSVSLRWGPGVENEKTPNFPHAFAVTNPQRR